MTDIQDGEVINENDAPQALAPTKAPGAILPTYSGPSMHRALQAYRELQAELDRGLAGCTMEIQGKIFRKRAYWEAVATAFNLSVEVVEQERVEFETEVDGQRDYGWYVRARAKTADGRYRDGDGACTLSEKTDREGKLTAMASEHNVRAHAMTRANNRAISNLVGFGEVSADELNTRGEKVASYPDRSGDTRKISEPQRKRMFALTKAAGRDPDDVQSYLASLGFERSADVTRDKYDEICKWIESDDDHAA